MKLTRAALTLGLAAALLVACGGDAKLSAGDAENVLRRSVLQAGDIPAFVETASQVQTNDAIARARPDTDQALAQYEQWGQLLQYNVQFSPDPPGEIDFSGNPAHVMNTATAFEAAAGARDAFESIRDLPSAVVANFLVNEGSGTKISNTQVTPLDGPQRGDDSFVWRISGTAQFETGLSAAFVADSTYVRYKNITGNVTVVAYGNEPRQDLVDFLVDAFLARIRDNV